MNWLVVERWVGIVFHYTSSPTTPDVIVTVVGAGTVTVTVPGVDEMYPSQNDEAV